jgi:hypothetical protein
MDIAYIDNQQGKKGQPGQQQQVDDIQGFREGCESLSGD